MPEIASCKTISLFRKKMIIKIFPTVLMYVYLLPSYE